MTRDDRARSGPSTTPTWRPGCAGPPVRPFGNGRPGPLDTPGVSGEAQQAEGSLYPQNLAFLERLHQLGIPVRSDDYGPGTHDWPYWQRELHGPCP